MSDDTLRKMEKRARSSEDPKDIKNLQNERDRYGFTATDAEYFAAYLEICERFIRGEISVYQADEHKRDYLYDDDHTETPEMPHNTPGLLQALNKKYQFLVGAKVIRTTVLANRMTNEDFDGFMPSRMC